MKIIFEPENKYINDISNWLQDEWDKTHIGLYNNFEFADKTTENFLCFVNENDEAIGFMIYALKDKTASIDLASVKESEKKKGICKQMLKSLCEKLLEKQIVVLELFCSPSSSEKIWKKLDFKEFKERNNHRFLNWENLKHPYLYKILVQVKKPLKSIKLKSFIEIWTLKDYKVNSNPDINPAYRWDVSNMDLPIIYPVDDKWKIRYVKDEIEISSGNIKSFNYSYSDYGNFLIINSLK